MPSKKFKDRNLKGSRIASVSTEPSLSRQDGKVQRGRRPTPLPTQPEPTKPQSKRKQYFIYVDNKPLGKRFVELKNISKQERTRKLKQHKDQLISKINSVEQQIKNIIPNVNILSRPYKAIAGIFVEHLSEQYIQQIKSINGVVNVVVAEASHKHLLDIVANDDMESEIGITTLWNNWDVSGNNVEVGVLDDGIDIQHKSIDSMNIVEGVNFTDYGASSGYGDSDTTNGHGTLVASIIGGNPGSWQGDIYWFESFTGIAVNSNFHIYKVCGEDLCEQDYLVAAIEHSMDPNQNDSFEDRLDVINMSLGGAGYPDTDPQSVAAGTAVEAGVTVVVSAGNHGPGTLSSNPFCRYNNSDGYQSICSPSCNPNVISVGAINKEYYGGEIEGYSGRGPTWPKEEYSQETYDKPDIVAVGGLIYGAASQVVVDYWEGESQTWDPVFQENWESSLFMGSATTDDASWWYRNSSGTSLSAPVVVGVISLIFEKHPEFKGCPPLIKHILKESAQMVPFTTNIHDIGAGNIDPIGAMGLADSISFTTCDAWIGDDEDVDDDEDVEDDVVIDECPSGNYDCCGICEGDGNTCGGCGCIGNTFNSDGYVEYEDVPVSCTETAMNCSGNQGHNCNSNGPGGYYCNTNTPGNCDQNLQWQELFEGNWVYGFHPIFFSNTPELNKECKEGPCCDLTWDTFVYDECGICGGSGPSPGYDCDGLEIPEIEDEWEYDTDCPEGQEWHWVTYPNAGYCVDEGECVCPGGMPVDLCEQYCCPAMGDLNGDGNHNILDVMILANCVLDNTCADEVYACAADLTGNGEYNLFDIIQLVNCVLAGNCGANTTSAQYRPPRGMSESDHTRAITDILNISEDAVSRGDSKDPVALNQMLDVAERVGVGTTPKPTKRMQKGGRTTSPSQSKGKWPGRNRKK